MQISARFGLIVLHLPDPLQEVHDLETDLGLTWRRLGGLGCLESQLDLCEHPDEEFVHVVVDPGRRFDVLAAVADGQGFAG